MQALALASDGPATCLDWNNNYADEEDKCILFHCGPVPADLMQHACIRARLPSGVPSPWEFAQGGEPFTVDVPGPLVLDAPMLMLEAVRQGVGVAQLAEWYVAEDLASGRLVRVLDEWTVPVPGLCIYYAGHRHLPAALRALVDLVHELRAGEEKRSVGAGRAKAKRAGGAARSSGR
jgi:DNA-binding transcriptional LysR family regulator